MALSDLLSIVGLAFDIVGVLWLLYATSQKNVDMAVGIALYEELRDVFENDWQSEEEKQKYDQSAVRTRKRLKWVRRIYVASIAVIVLGFGLQIAGVMVA